MEHRCYTFADKGKCNNRWAIGQVTAFLQFQRPSTKGEITEATLHNFVESDELKFIAKGVQSTTMD
jgi:hypothetical protein